MSVRQIQPSPETGEGDWIHVDLWIPIEATSSEIIASTLKAVRDAREEAS